MKKSLFIFFLSLLNCNTFCQVFKHDSSMTTLIIIGVVHTENKNRNSDSLVEILKKIRPNIILNESDTISGYFKNDYSLVKPSKWYNIGKKMGIVKKMPPENEAIYKYKSSDNNVMIYPFDIAIPNRKKYVKNYIKFFDSYGRDLELAFNNNEFPIEYQDMHKLFNKYSNSVYGKFNMGYFGLNQPQVTDSIRQMFNLEYSYVPTLIEKVDRLKIHKKEYEERKDYWVTRNEKMADNILNFIKKNKGKTIIVLTGLLHKYYLTDLLNPYEDKHNFKMIEFYEY
jgi:hypothetical protein